MDMELDEEMKKMMVEAMVNKIIDKLFEAKKEEFKKNADIMMDGMINGDKYRKETQGKLDAIIKHLGIEVVVEQ